MKKNILLLSFLFGFSLALFAQTASQLQDIETLYQRTYSEVLSRGFVASNIETALNKLGTNGRFTDVNYAMDGTVDFKNNLVIAVNKAAIVLVTGTAPNYTITVSDPLYVSNNSIKMTIYNQTLSGKNASVIDRNTVINCTMPTGYFIGSSFQNSYSGTLGLTGLADEPKSCKSSVKAYSSINGLYRVKAEKEMKQIEVYNMQGQRVWTTKGICSNQTQVDLSTGCSNGVYFLHILFADEAREKLSVIK